MLARSQFLIPKTAGTDWCEAGAYCLDEVVFMGVDTLGNAGVATTTLALDYLPPDAPAITLPWNRTWVRGERVKVVGTAGEPFLTIEIAGGAGVVTTTAGADGSWQLDVPLSESQQQLMATAIDSMGNRSLPTERAKVVVRRDTQPPVVTPLPQAGGAGGGTIFTRRGQLFTLSATTNDAGLVRMTWADTTHPQIGVNVPLGGWNFDENSIGQPTAWARTVGPVGVDGDYSVTYRAIDAVGNEGVSAAQRLVVDSVAPVLTVTQITASAPFGWVQNTAFVWRCAGEVVLTTTTQAIDDRSGLAMAGGALSYTFVESATSTWPAVSFDRVLQQFDRSGNLGVTSVRVANDLTPPALMVNGTARTTNGTATLNVSVSDMQSGVRGVDVTIVQDGITRTVLATNTLATQITANGLAFGSVYVWEVTATDNVNNATFSRFTVVSARATKTYYFGSMRVAVRDGDVLSYLHNDHLSSVSASTDANGKLIGVQLFAPYGELRAEWGKLDGTWGWASHHKAESNGLTFMRARWYLAGIGRFVQPDSIIPEPTYPESWNRYSYSRNSPLSFIDVSGHVPYPITIRSFAPFAEFGRTDIGPITVMGPFHGDNRGYSTSSSVTSRVEAKISFDTDATSVSISARSDPSWPVNNPADVRTEQPASLITRRLSTQAVSGGRQFTFASWYGASNPFLPTSGIDKLRFLSEIDVDASFSIIEDRKKEVLNVSGSLYGDNFPATEAFITDPSGQTVFLGIGFYENAKGKDEGPSFYLPGHNQRPITDFDLSISLDKKGNFSGVNYQGRSYSLADWNTGFIKANPHDRKTAPR